MRTFAFVHQTPDVTRAWLSQVASAVAVQLARDVAPAWGLAPPRVDTRVYDEIDDVPRGAWPIVLLQNADVAGYLGYHGETELGEIYARVFTRGLALADVSRTISHEVIEALIDPSCNRWVDGPDGLVYALEVADPVEADGYPIGLGEVVVHVSDFVLPAWFDPTTPGDAPTDHLGLLKGAWQVRPGGHTLFLEAQRGMDGESVKVAVIGPRRRGVAGGGRVGRRLLAQSEPFVRPI